MPRLGAHRGDQGLVNLFSHVGCGCWYFGGPYGTQLGPYCGVALGQVFSSSFFFFLFSFFFFLFRPFSGVSH